MPSISITDPDKVTQLKLGTSTVPKVGGDVDLSKFTNLSVFRGDNLGLKSIVGLENLLALTNLNIQNNQLTSAIPDLSANTQLLNFNCFNNQLTGSIPDLSSNTQLKTFGGQSNQLTGSIPDLTSNTALTLFNCNTNQLTGFAGGSFSSTLLVFKANANQLTESAVNAILAAFVAAGSSNGTLYLAGNGNAAPTGQGVIDLATLGTRGWDLQTN